MTVSEIKLYDLLRIKIGDREAEAFIELIEQRVEKKFVEKQNEFVLEKDKEKLLTKADAIAIFSTKEDLAKLEVKMTKLYSDGIKWYFVGILGLFFSLCTVIFALFNIYLKH